MEFTALRGQLIGAVGTTKDEVKLKMDEIKKKFEVIRLEVI